MLVRVRAGHERAAGRTDSQMHRLFYLRFGMTVLEALAQKRADMDKLRDMVQSDTNSRG